MGRGGVQDQELGTFGFGGVGLGLDASTSLGFLGHLGVYGFRGFWFTRW